MATIQYDLDRQEAKYEITETTGSAITDDISVTVDLAVGLTKLQVLQSLDKLKQHITEGAWPPA